MIYNLKGTKIYRDYQLLKHISYPELRFVGYRVKDLPHAMAETIRDYMKEFIVYRLLWCLGFVLVGAFVVIKTMSFGYAMERRSSKREGRLHDYTSRRGPRASGRRRR